MKIWKPVVIAVALFTALTLPSQQDAPKARTLPKISDEDLFPDKVLARGKGFEVKQSELENAFISYKASLAARGTALPESKREKAEIDLLDQLIFEKILVKRATDADKAVAQKESDKAFAEVETKIPQNVFVQRLRASGMDLASFRERLLSEALRRAVLDRELKAEIKIPDSEIKKFYEEFPVRFEIPEQARASHILISTIDKSTGRPVSDTLRGEKKKQIETIREKIKEGEDFAKVAKEVSEDPGSRERGGEYTFARGEMVKPFENAAFTLKPGELSDVVESQFGFHVIKLHEKLPAHKRPLSDATEDIRKLLTTREFDKQLPLFFEKLKKEAGVEILRVKSEN